jgi:AP endonuclease 2
MLLLDLEAEISCRPVGPGYDRGRGERLRTEVDHRYKVLCGSLLHDLLKVLTSGAQCNFFMWSSDVRRGEPSTNVSAD